MIDDWGGIAAGGAGAVGAGSLCVWAFKAWVNSVNRKLNVHEERLDTRLKEITTTLHAIQLRLERSEGEKTAKEELVWREINTDKIKIVKFQSQMEKVWRIIPIMAAKMGLQTERTSDVIEGLIEDSMKGD